jgi:hypothetical protein
MIIFLIQVVIVLLAPVIDNPLRLLIIPLNLVIAVVFGWRLYKSMYHMVFIYDDKGFSLKKGKREESSHGWNEFSRVSLVRAEYGDFSVRLYHNEEFFDLPASKLKLNPFDFRLEAMRLVSASKGQKIVG